MKLNKIFKKFKKEWKITFLLSLLPITLLVGILWQIAILSKYNALVFFSWWQVLNDTAILMLQVIVFFLWVLSAYVYYLIKTTKIEKWCSWIILFLFFSIVWWISIWFFKNIYITSIITSFFLGYFAYVTTFIVWDRWKHPGKNDNYIIPIIFNILILLIVLLFWFILNHFYSFLYQNIEIKIINTNQEVLIWTWNKTNETNYKINYMNDKYIIYSSWSETKIIPNDWKNEFIINDNLKN